MASSFTVKVDDRNIKLLLDTFPKTLQAKLESRIKVLTAELLARVRAGEPARTGALRAATRSYVDSRPGLVRGSVKVGAIPGRGRGHNVAAAALEYGAHRTFGVRASTRDGYRVRAYHRRANIRERRFLRGPIEAMRAKILAELQAAIDEAIAETNKST